jgi:hypothetical protein
MDEDAIQRYRDAVTRGDGAVTFTREAPIYTLHLFEYDHEGATWQFAIFARDRADAEARVERLALYGRWKGDHAQDAAASGR